MWKDCQALQDEITALRRELHQIPEVGAQLPETAACLSAHLDRLGIPFVRSPRDSGLIASIQGGLPGRTVALRADMDALPIQEETGLPFSSRRPGVMHACGHDAHAAMLMGAAQVLQKHRKELRGTVRLLFQPAEEQCEGAKVMLEQGALDGVDAIFGFHIGTLLGAEQSGFIADIGFETYQKIMREAVAELRAEGLDVAGLSDREQEVVEQLRYVEDTAVEVDVEAELPDSYVSQTAEKLRLYRELDAMRSEEELQRFEQRLVDRFGALPQAARELLDVVRLRWEAVRLGMERVKVKNGLMIVHFVGDAASPFYKSEVFSELLRRVTRRPDKFVLKQHNNRLAMTVRGVTDIAGAWEILKSLYKEQDA